MAPGNEMHTANVNRSIRTIKAELEYLCDASVISPETLSDLLSRVPAQTPLHAPLSVGALPSAMPNTPQPPTSPMSNLSLHNAQRTNSTGYNEKTNFNSFPQPTSPAPPPVYQHPPPPQGNWPPPPLAQATALYAYSSADVGDLELQPNDHITVTEYMNAEWWKGRSSRTGHEGIFPRSYVQVHDDKGPMLQSPPPPPNMPYQPQPGPGDGAAQPHQSNHMQQMAGKFGKKLGNAAIFGAGATMGSDLVNAIL